MVVYEQDLPIEALPSEATDDALAPLRDAHPAGRTTKNVGAGVNRIGQDVMDRVVDGQFPDDVTSVFDCVVHGRQHDALLP